MFHAGDPIGYAEVPTGNSGQVEKTESNNEKGRFNDEI